ncbi:MAG: hypothetical protein KAR06_09010 [Deltaproteobacteria bacterium]|nr:hypothetical protein [Deltaproteobacteria bacterium]
MEPETMEDIVTLKWNFTPKDYFEDEIRIDRDDYEMIIKDGLVEAHINAEVYDKEHKMRDSLHQKLNARFLGVQLLRRRPYTLSKASMYRIHPDGRKDVTVFPEPCVMTMTARNADIVVKDKDGNVVSDSRRDRVEKEKEFAELAERHSSDLDAENLLNSYNAAVNDPNNELVHLYEIRDALSTLFSDGKKARKELGLSVTKWNRLGTLASREPLKQGRHRGQSTGKLRDASEKELTEARDIACDFIEAYWVYLDECNNQTSR